MSPLTEKTSSNFTGVKNLEVADNTVASKTVSFASTIAEIDFELTDLKVQDACASNKQHSYVKEGKTSN